MTESRPVVLWFRRDLRLRDLPALVAAADVGPVVPLFVVDPALAGTSANRRAHLARSLRELDRQLDGRLVVRSGPPERVVPEVVAEAGEAAARHRWEEFLDRGLDDYATDRDRPDLPGTSRLSVALRFGELHPRTLLADVARHGGDDARAFRAELAWREFHADRLWHRPEAVRHPLRPEFARMEHDEPGPAYDAWCAGRTGFPLVDAGMRQLVATGWMHNRVRMVTASFLVKDLHVHWTHPVVDHAVERREALARLESLDSSDRRGRMGA